MKILRGILLFMYSIDKGIYRDKITPNRYFATFSMLALLLVGTYSGMGFEENGWWYPESTDVNNFIIISLVWVLNVAEGIMAANRWWVSLARAGMLSVMFFFFGRLAQLLAPVAGFVIVILWLIAILVTEIIVAVKGKKEASGSIPFDLEYLDRQPRFCGNCGAPIEANHQFCGQCGQPV